jgi:hypothetical protein
MLAVMGQRAMIVSILDMPLFSVMKLMMKYEVNTLIHKHVFIVLLDLPTRTRVKFAREDSLPPSLQSMHDTPQWGRLGSLEKNIVVSRATQIIWHLIRHYNGYICCFLCQWSMAVQFTVWHINTLNALAIFLV